MKIFCLLVIVAMVAACKKEAVDIPKSKEVKRLVMAYMVADNDLDYFAVQNINDMEAGMSEDFEGKLLVYIDRNNKGYPPHPYLMEIQHDTTARIISKIVCTWPEQNSADANMLRRVISEAKNYYPEFTSLGLILWSHGSAWIPSNVPVNTKRGQVLGGRIKSFALDDNPTDSAVMEIKSLAQSLRGNSFDFILFDACYMGCVEMGYELKEMADFLIASPTEVLSYGFPYKKMVPLFGKKIIHTKAMAEEFYASYQAQKGIFQSASVAVINLKNIDHFTSRPDKFFTQIATLTDTLKIDRKQRQQLSLAGNNSPVWAYDLKDFIQYCVTQVNNKEVNREWQTVLEEYNKTVWSSLHTDYLFNSLSLTNCHGLSTYIPNSFNNQTADDYYKTLSWYQQSGYGKIVFSFDN